ncbi:MAG: hypothetical protein AAF193_12215, partial [Bacteroidota bacterium]
INNDLVLQGTPDLPISISSTEAGTQASFQMNSGTVSGTYLVLQDNNASGGAFFSATQSLDNGNNSGWNIEELQPQDYYWVGNGGEWSDAANHWATTSGGSNFHNFPPSVLDNVYFDDNSFTATDQQVTIQNNVSCHDMDWSEVTNSPVFNPAGNNVNIYGSVYFAENMSVSNGDWFMLSTENEVISTMNENGFGTSAEVYFQSGGTFDLQANFKSRVLQFESGEFNSNGYDVWVDFNLYFSGQDDKVFDIQNSSCYFRGLQWNDNLGDNLFFDNTGGLIQWSGTLSPGNFNDQLDIVHIFNDLLCESNGFQDQAQVNTNIEANTLTIAPGKTLQFWLSTQVTV